MDQYMLVSLFGDELTTVSVRVGSRGSWPLAATAGGRVVADVSCDGLAVSVSARPGHLIQDLGDTRSADGTRSRVLLPKPGLQRLDLVSVSGDPTLPVMARLADSGVGTYRTFVPRGSVVVEIGRSEACGLCYQSPLVSARHAEIRLGEEGCSVRDLGAYLGVYVDGRRMAPGETVVLGQGSVLQVLELTVMYAGGMLLMNAPSGLTVGGGALVELDRQRVMDSAPPALGEDEVPASRPFWPAPRLMSGIRRRAFTVDGPPPAKEPENTPILMRIGPSFLMGISSMFMAASAVSRIMDGASVLTTMPSIAMCFSMVGAMVLWPFVTRRFERQQAERDEARRRSAYADYLAGIEAMLAKERATQQEILEENRLDAARCLGLATTRSPLLMGRSPQEPDFLSLRVGRGSLDLEADIRWPEGGFTLDDDDLLAMARRLSERPPMLEDTPVAVDFAKLGVVGVCGDWTSIWALVRSLVAQAATLWNAHDVKVAVISSADEAEWSFMRELPHTLAEDGRTRLVATTEPDVRELGMLLGRELAGRQASPTGQRHADPLPHYLVICADRQLADSADAMGRLLQRSEEDVLGFTMVYLADRVEGLPRECVEVIELGRGGASRAYGRTNVTASSFDFVPDPAFPAADARALAHALARVDLGGQEDAFVLPRSLGFLEMYGAGSVEALAVSSRWARADASRSLSAPLGLDSRGGLATLDPHESYDGPHGLVAGTTGSGKSELLISWILSVAVTFPPEQAAFVLIDYKGGGLADAFSREGMALPHLAGTVTNLDGDEVTRSLASLEAELVRRQGMLAEAKRVTGDGTMDIISYQRHWAAGDVREPMPHLFVVADEFAELKQQEPEFMDGLVSAARIGRSLGVHLVLATQKPTGVVSDQIAANARFRVCLKVADAADSKEMIRRDDAARLEGPGRLILLVGYDERLALAQAAWAGAPYVAREEAKPMRDDSVELCGETGAPLLSVHPERESADGTELDAVLGELCRVAGGREARKLWLPPLEAHPTVDGLAKRYAGSLSGSAPWALDPLVGELDDPARQEKRALTLPLSEEGNAMVFGGAGSGRTDLANAILWDALHRSPEDVRAYAVDAVAGSLLAFDGAAQVPNVLRASDSERVTNLVRMLMREIRSRREAFGDRFADLDAYNQRMGERRLPSILIVVNGVAQFLEANPAVEDALASLLRDGPTYGIHFVLLADAPRDIRFRLRSSIRLALALQLADDDDYATVLGSVRGQALPQGGGRGLVSQGDELHAFQTAYVCEAGAGAYVAISIARTEGLSRWGAPQNVVPVFPKVLSSTDCAELEGELPLGMLAHELVPFSLAPSRGDALAVLAAQTFLCVPFMQAAAQVAHERGMDVVAIDPSGALGATPWWVQSQTVAGAREVMEKDGGKGALVLVPSARTTMDVPDAAWLRALAERPQAHPGVLVLCAASAQELSPMQGQPWGQRLLSRSGCIWVGQGLANAYALHVVNPPSELKDTLGTGGGFVLREGRAHPVKLGVLAEGKEWE